jgi:hypothetical protein
MHHLPGTIAAAILAAIAVFARAEEQEAAADKPANEIRGKIEAVEARIADLQQQKEALERQAGEAERLAHQRQELAEYREQSRERTRDVEERIAEIGREEPPATAARRALVEGRLKFLNARKALDARILAIENVAALEQARQVRTQIDEMETEWDLVANPRLERAVAIEEMEEKLKEEGDAVKQGIVERLKQLLEKDGESRRLEFELRKGRHEREKAWDRMVEEFHR